MSNVVTIRGNLFSAPEGSILIHACNCRGKWGKGIAKEFAKRFPRSQEIYFRACQEKGSSLLGTAILIDQGKYTIGCLFTSRGYKEYTDSPPEILLATRSAITDMIRQNTKLLPMHMCKINSGLFRVDWSDTKKILKEFEQQFTVYDY